MGITNYLTKKKKQFIDNYRRDQQKRKEIKKAEESAYHAAKIEARKKRAVDRAYNEEGYHRNNSGTLKRNKPQTKPIIQRTQNTLSHIAQSSQHFLNTNMPHPYQQQSTTRQKPKTKTQKRKTKRQQKRQTKSWETYWY